MSQRSEMPNSLLSHISEKLQRPGWHEEGCEFRDGL